jgi:hypothetical protein
VTDFEQVLWEDLYRSTAGIEIRPGLAARAYRRRKRRIAARAVTATAAAAAIAISATAALGQPGTGTRAMTAAYVISRSEAALTAVTAENPVVYLDVDLSGGVGLDGMNQSAEVRYVQQEQWYYGNQPMLGVDVNAAGQPVYASGLTGNTATGVDYGAKAWWQTQIPPSENKPSPIIAPTCANDGKFAVLDSPPQWAADIKEALSCGLYKTAGTEQVDGVDAIKLEPVGPHIITAVLWLDPSTYLPVKISTYSVNADNSLSFMYTESVSWLPPTSANLAKLAPPIPAGFTKLPDKPALTCDPRGNPSCNAKWQAQEDAWYQKYLAPLLSH